MGSSAEADQGINRTKEDGSVEGSGNKKEDFQDWICEGGQGR